MKLNIGCGLKIKQGYINVDKDDYGDSRILIHDLSTFPWPFPDNQFEEVQAFEILEHLPDQVATMTEIHRVCQDGASVIISVPHFSGENTWADPTHLRGYTTRTFKYFCEGGLYPMFRFKKQELRVSAALPILNIIPKILGYRLYERMFCYLLPCQGLRVFLENMTEHGHRPERKLC